MKVLDLKHEMKTKYLVYTLQELLKQTIEKAKADGYDTVDLADCKLSPACATVIEGFIIDQSMNFIDSKDTLVNGKLASLKEVVSAWNRVESLAQAEGHSISVTSDLTLAEVIDLALKCQPEEYYYLKPGYVSAKVDSSMILIMLLAPHSTFICGRMQLLFEQIQRMLQYKPNKCDNVLWVYKGRIYKDLYNPRLMGYGCIPSWFCDGTHLPLDISDKSNPKMDPRYQSIINECLSVFSNSCRNDEDKKKEENQKFYEYIKCEPFDLED